MTKLDMLVSDAAAAVKTAAIGRALEDTPINLPNRKDNRLALLIALELNEHLVLTCEEHALLVGVSRQTLAKMRQEKRIQIAVNG